MTNRRNKPELLCPAGNPEKLAAALRYGADAVYLAGNRFGMRSAADNFTVEELYEAAEREEALEQAVERGLRILGCGGISQRALENRLTQKGVKRQLAKEAAERLAQRGYLNENAQALREAERCVGKLWGPRRIEASLRSKGYSSEVVQRAMYALEGEGTDFVHLCAERIRGQKQEPPREPRERQKWMAALSRYGFSGSEIREALRLLKQE